MPDSNYLTKQYNGFLVQAQKNPQLVLLLNNFRQGWQKYGYRIKIGLVIFVVFLIIVLGIRFGSSLARIFAPTPVTPVAIPDVTPIPTTTINSELQKIQTQIKSFNILLPDPAAPAVDPNIYLETLPIKDN